MEIEEPLILYTVHALHRMSVRGITKEMVREALVSPEQTGLGYRNRNLAYKSFGGRGIKVIYVKEDDRFVVISVMWSN